MSSRLVSFIIAGCLLSFTAHADLKVYSPRVDKGEFAFGNRGNSAIDDDDGEDRTQRHVFEVEYGVTDWWQTALVSRLNKPEDGSLRYDTTAGKHIPADGRGAVLARYRFLS